MTQFQFLKQLSQNCGLTFRKYKTAYQKKVGGYSIILSGEGFEILIRCRQKYRKFRKIWLELYLGKEETHYASVQEVEDSDIPAQIKGKF